VAKGLATVFMMHNFKLKNTNFQRAGGRDNLGAGVPEWTPAGVCILGWSRSKYFRFKQGRSRSQH